MWWNYFCLINYFCAGCQHKLRNNSGSFTSGNFVHNSNADFQYCSWSIKVDVTSRISLKFPYLYVSDCEENSLDVYDGDSANTSKLLANFCGDNATSGATVLSTANNLYITLKSGSNSKAKEDIEDVSIKRLQFRAEYNSFQTGT